MLSLSTAAIEHLARPGHGWSTEVLQLCTLRSWGRQGRVMMKATIWIQSLHRKLHTRVLASALCCRP